MRGAVAAILLVPAWLAFSDTSSDSDRPAPGVLMVWTSEKQQLIGLDLDRARVAWTREPEPTYEIPLKSGSRLFLRNLAGDLRCLDARTGRVLWARKDFRVDWWEAFGSALVLWVDSELYSLDAGTGAQRWHAELPDAVDAVYPLAGSCLARCRNGAILSLDWVRGGVRWKFEAGEPLAFVRRVDDRLICAANDTARLFCLDARDGRLSWEASARVSDGSSAPAEDRMIATDGTSQVECLNLSTGRTLWRRESPGGSLRVVIVESAWIVWSAADGALFRLDPSTGKRLWSSESLGQGSSLVSCGRSLALVDSQSCRVRLVNLDTGVVTGAIASRYGVPVFGSDTILTTEPDGQVLAARLSTGEILWSGSGVAEPCGLFLSRRRAIIVGPEGLEIRALDSGRLLRAQPFDASYDFAWFGS